MKGKKSMKRKKRTFFLPVIMAAGLLLGACNSTPVNPGPAVVTYGVTFDANGGTGTMEGVIGITGEYTLPECAFTAPAGKHFAGWKLNGQGDLLQPGTKVTLTDNASIVAQWEVTTYTVSFNANSGTGEMANVPNIVGEYTVPACTFTAPAGKHFIGWKVNGEGDLVQPEAKINVTGNVSLVAQWDSNVYTVTFMNGDVVFDTQQVTHGEKATAPATNPTKAAPEDGSVLKYEFRGWDKDLDAIITSDTVINAKFAAYAAEIKVDDFEGYADKDALKETGKWAALGYSNTTQDWTTDTKADVSLGSKVSGGSKSLRFDAWANTNDYKVQKTFTAGQFDKSANALRFSLRAPRCFASKVLLYVNALVNGEVTEVKFVYTLNISSSEYVEYTIPLADEGWLAWGEAKYGTLHTLAEAAGISEDDALLTATKIEFYFKGNDGAGGQPSIMFLDDLKFVTLESPAKGEVEEMGSYARYTGLAASGNTIELNIGAQGAATAKVLDMKDQPTIPGTIAIAANKEVTFTSADQGATLVYKGKLVDGGQSIQGISADGTNKELVGAMNLLAVQTVDNFDQYETDGVAWYQGNKDNPERRSGARGAYYSEYCPGGSVQAEFGGAGWSLMGGSGDQLKLKQDGGHSGQNYLCMKNSATYGMRYMQFGLIDGTSEQNNFRGNKLSFWAKTNGLVKQFVVRMYSQTKPRNATKDNDVKKVTFNETEAIGSWKRYEVELNPKLTYYGFCIFMEKNQTKDSYLYIDDVEVFGEASPYAQPDITMPKNAIFNTKINGLFKASIEIKSDTTAKLSCPGLGMNLDATYVTNTEEIEISLPGDVKYTATVADNGKTLKYKAVSGEGAVANALKNLNFSAVIIGENAEAYDKDGTTMYKDHEDVVQSGARGAYYVDMYNGGSGSSPVGGKGWALPSSDAMVNLEKTEKVDGAQSLKLKNSKYGNARYIQWDLYKGTAKPITGVNRFSIYLKNGMAVDTKEIKVMVYKTQHVTSSTQGADYRVEPASKITMKASQDWTKYTVNLDASKTYYGFALLFTTDWSNEGFIYADAGYFYNEGSDPEVNFYALNGLTLAGTINVGAASIAFGENGVASLTCSALGGTVEGKYAMQMNGANQQLTITVSGDTINGTIVGTYAVSAQGVVTFTIIKGTGDFAAAVAADQVLTYSPVA